MEISKLQAKTSKRKNRMLLLVSLEWLINAVPASAGIAKLSPEDCGGEGEELPLEQRRDATRSSAMSSGVPPPRRPFAARGFFFCVQTWLPLPPKRSA